MQFPERLNEDKRKQIYLHRNINHISRRDSALAAQSLTVHSGNRWKSQRQKKKGEPHFSNNFNLGNCPYRDVPAANKFRDYFMEMFMFLLQLE